MHLLLFINVWWVYFMIWLILLWRCLWIISLSLVCPWWLSCKFIGYFKKYKEVNLVFSWEESHFMVQEGIIVGHKVLETDVEVDRCNCNLLIPWSVNQVRSFLHHRTFYVMRFIREFSKAVWLLIDCVAKDKAFNFDDSCLEAIEKNWSLLVSAPYIMGSWLLSSF